LKVVGSILGGKLLLACIYLGFYNIGIKNQRKKEKQLIGSNFTDNEGTWIDFEGAIISSTFNFNLIQNVWIEKYYIDKIYFSLNFIN
jgi:hypothetical protein